MAKLRLVPPSGDPIEITADSVVVGRDPSVDVLLSDGSVSRKHAVLQRRGTGWVVVDQGSANGTFVDSHRIAETVLRPGQELRFGAVGFRVEIESEGPDTTLMPQPEPTVVQPAVAPPAPPRPVPAAPPLPPLPGTHPPARPAAPAAPPPPPRPAGPAPRYPPPPSAPGSMSGAPGMGVPPRKGKSPVFWILTGCGGCLTIVFLVIALFVGSLFFFSSEPVNTVRGQLTEIKQGNLDAAYDRLSESYKAQLSRSDFESLVERHPAMKDNKDSTFLSRSVSGDTARLVGYLDSTTGGKEPVSYELVKESGSWKISRIGFNE